MSMPCIEIVYPPFPNKWERALILSMREEKIITFEDQNVFKNKLSFKRTMKKLHDQYHIVVWRHEKNGCNEYKLTGFGERIGDILHEFVV